MSAPRSKGKRTGLRGVRLQQEVEAAIQREADERGLTWSAMANELLDEAIRMRRAPGVAFVDGAVGRRAVLAGTGLDVWELVRTWRESGEDSIALAAAYPWLSELQLRAAMGNYWLYPAEIEDRLNREAAWTPERVWSELPFARPLDPNR